MTAYRKPRRLTVELDYTAWIDDDTPVSDSLPLSLDSPLSGKHTVGEIFSVIRAELLAKRIERIASCSFCLRYQGEVIADATFNGHRATVIPRIGDLFSRPVCLVYDLQPQS